MKKIRKLLAALMLVICSSALAVPVSAYKIGDVIGRALYTDIIASINDYNIASYNINNYTAVVAEDLRNYGFDVIWLDEERALYIDRAATNKVDSTYISPVVPASLVGKKAQNVLYTDIKTYINGAEVPSYNINGKTIVFFEDLSVFGNIEYSEYNRRLDLSIDDGLNYKISAPFAYTEFSPSGLYFKTNSADGLQIRWTAYNNTNKTIKYYTTTYYMYNAVGDFAYDSWGQNYFTIRIIGPAYPGQEILNFTTEYKAEVYDAPVHHVQLYTIFLEYTDGTSETIYYNYFGTEEYGKYVL